MKHEPVSPRKRRPVNISLEADTAEAARELGINVSAVCNEAMAGAVKSERQRRWKEENRPIIEDWNRWIEKNGLPLERYRLF